MYATCLYCHAHLGANEALEAFPVGRRLAFDAARLRLWVVCPRCKRWNLSPFDARERAIEQAERLFRDTRLRMSTDEIGLARQRDGTDLIRIGAPQRPELAAWRYGWQFLRRRRVAAAVGAMDVARTIVDAGFMVAPLFGLLMPVSTDRLRQLGTRAWERANRLRLPGREPGTAHLVETEHARRAVVTRDPATGRAALRVPGVAGDWVEYGPADTPRILGKLLPRAHWQGGGRR